jgi:hypothetical protein
MPFSLKNTITLLSLKIAQLAGLETLFYIQNPLFEIQ